MRYLLTILALLISTTVFAENKYNPYTGEYEVVPEHYILRPNASQGGYVYAPPRARLEPNMSTGTYEYPGQGSHRPAPMTQDDFTPPEFQRSQEQNSRLCQVMGLYGCE